MARRSGSPWSRRSGKRSERPSTAGVGLWVGTGVAAAVGVTAFDFADAAPKPAAFLALTVNVYVVPLASPPRVQLNAPVVVQVLPPGAEVTV